MVPPSEFKTCSACQQSLPVSAFYVNVRGDKQWYHGRCKACEWEDLKARRAAKRPPKPEPVVRTEKPCSVCKVVKPLSEFGKDNSMKDGLLCACKACRWAYDKQKRAADPKRNQQLRESYERNKAKIYANKTARYQENIEVERAKDKEWYRANPDKVKAKIKKQTQRNAGRRDEINKVARNWRKKNPDKAHALDHTHAHKKRARKADVGGSFTFEEFAALCDRYDKCCLCCGENSALTADHILPITCGGVNSIENLQPLCRSCNSRKHTKHIDYRPETPADYRGVELSIRI